MRPNAKLNSPACERNKEPLMEVLSPYLQEKMKILEIASGTGQHGFYFTSRFPHITWQPTDVDEDALASIAAWKQEAGENLSDPFYLSCLEEQNWPEPESFDFILNCNMIHISPWETCIGLMKHGSKVLKKGGMLALYGPFFHDMHAPEPSNLSFNESLKSRDSQWGIRQLTDVIAVANDHGFTLEKTIPMPANNMVNLFSL